jgi:hypothetical protein
MRGNLKLVRKQVDTASEQLLAAHSNIESRREIVMQGRDALVVSEEKAARVAAEAPGFVDRASAAHEDSGPIASEAGATAGETANQDPEDEESAEKMGAIGSEMSTVASDAGTVDSAVTQTQARAEGLVEDAAEAQEKNTATAEKLDTTDASLDEADERLNELDETTALADAHVSALMGGPGEMEAGAADLDSQALTIIDHSASLESELRATEDTYQSEMRAIPGQEAIAAAAEREGGGAAEGVIQRDAESAYGDRIKIDLIGAFRSEPTAKELREQERRRLEADERRRAHIRDIEARANGDFSSLSALERMSIALELTGDNLWHKASEIDWPNMASQIVLSFVDPRVSLMGVVEGLNGVLSGAANLFSLEQWEKDPLGNLLKSSADIATGLTTILGSIAGLCTAILVILGALAIFTFGAMAPVFWAATAFLGPIISTVGGWALVTAAIAAALHGFVFIKNLVDAATADTATEMEHEVDQMSEDGTQIVSAASEVVIDRMMVAGGKRLTDMQASRSLGNATEGVSQGMDTTPPPRLTPDMDVPPAAALGEGGPPAAAAVETGPVPETAAPAASAAKGAPSAAVEPPAPVRPPESASVPDVPPPPPPRPPAPAATTPPPPPARAPETAAPRPAGSAATAAATDVGPPPATTRPPETPPAVAPEPPRTPETPEPPRAVEPPEPPRAVEAPDQPRTAEAPDQPRTAEAPDQPRTAGETAAPEPPRSAETTQPPRTGEAPDSPPGAGEPTASETVARPRTGEAPEAPSAPETAAAGKKPTTIAEWEELHGKVETQKAPPPKEGITAQPTKTKTPFEEYQDSLGETPEAQGVHEAKSPGGQESIATQKGNFIHRFVNQIPAFIKDRLLRGDASSIKLIEQLEVDWPSGVQPNTRRFKYKGNTLIPDGIDWDNGIVYELKPNTNSKWVKRGTPQIAEYVEALNHLEPRPNGKPWVAAPLVTYNSRVLERLLVKWGVLPKPKNKKRARK